LKSLNHTFLPKRRRHELGVDLQAGGLTHAGEASPSSGPAFQAYPVLPS
jgi:hypothetical protein